ncbi:hypothetical protein, partial [Syntrophomonas wolfei]
SLFGLETEWERSQGRVCLEVLREGKRMPCQLEQKSGRELGIIPAPDPYNRRYLLWQEDNVFEILQKIWGKFK